MSVDWNSVVFLGNLNVIAPNNLYHSGFFYDLLVVKRSVCLVVGLKITFIKYAQFCRLKLLPVVFKQ